MQIDGVNHLSLVSLHGMSTCGSMFQMLNLLSPDILIRLLDDLPEEKRGVLAV